MQMEIQVLLFDGQSRYKWTTKILLTKIPHNIRKINDNLNMNITMNARSLLLVKKVESGG